MQATMAENDEVRSRPEINSAKVNAAIVVKYKNMKANTEYTAALGTTWPEIFSGDTACGCTSVNISRNGCLIRISERNILMPPPVEPVLAHRLLRNSIHIGANIGQLA